MKTPMTGQFNCHLASYFFFLPWSVDLSQIYDVCFTEFHKFHTPLYGCNFPAPSTTICQITHLLDRSRGNLNYFFSYATTPSPSSSLALFIQINSSRAPFHLTNPHYRNFLVSLHVVLRFPRNTGCVRRPRIWLAISILAANILRLRFAS